MEYGCPVPIAVATFILSAEYLCDIYFVVRDGISVRPQSHALRVAADQE